MKSSDRQRVQAQAEDFAHRHRWLARLLWFAFALISGGLLAEAVTGGVR